MEKTIYTVVKNIPGFNFNIGDEFHIVNNECYVKKKMNNSMYTALKRQSEFDSFPFGSFSSNFKKAVKNVNDCPYEIGDLVVTNKYGLMYFQNSQCLIDSKPRNEIWKVKSNPTYTSDNRYKLEVVNIMNGERKEINEKQILAKSKPYWFIDSHGKIQMTYYFLRPVEDKYRIATDNVFNSYDNAMAARDAVKYNEISTMDKLKEYVENF